MKRKGVWLSGGIGCLGLLLAVAAPAWAGGIEDFKLIRAIPADAMIVTNSRDHAGKEFVNRQFERVWDVAAKQGFDRDVKRLLRGMLEDQGQDVEAFDAQWQQITDLAAGVTWSKLCARECAFAMKVGMPTGVDFVLLMMPPEQEAAQDFDGLSAILKNLVGLAPEGALMLSTEGEGDAVVHKLFVPNSMPPISLTLARHKDVLLVGFGPAMVEQTLALLRGQSDAATAALVSTERFKQALKRLPAPTDGFYFVDAARLMAQFTEFAQMAAQMAAAAETQPAEDAPPGGPAAFLPRAVALLDLWDYAAGVEATDGMKTTSENIVVLREDAKDRPLYKGLYGNEPIRDPLKFIPKEATSAGVNNGFDFHAIYKTIVEFIEKEVPEGKDLVTQFKDQQTQVEFSLEEDVLSWLGGGFAHFAATRGSAYVQEWVFMLNVRDEQKANLALEKLSTRLNAFLVPQNGAVEDAKLEAAEGFKRVILPAFLAMLPIGRPIYGVKDGQMFVGSGPEIVTMALEVGAGQRESFAKNERYLQEGLPVGQGVTGFSFEDLSRWGEELGQKLAMAGLMQMFMPPEAARNPAISTLFSMVNKVGRVVKSLDFYKSSCSVSTFDGKLSSTKSVINYQEPPKPAPTTQEAPADAEAAPAEEPEQQ